MRTFDDDFKPYTISENLFEPESMRIDTALVMKTSPCCQHGEFAAMEY